MATPIDPTNVQDWDVPLNTAPTYSVTYTFSTDDILGTFEGLRQGDVLPFGVPVIDFSATPKTTTDGVDLFPINSEFGYLVTDFIGAVTKDFDANPEYAEGWAGDITDGLGNQVGVVISDSPTDTFKTPALLGTWLAGLGGNTVKASTEHYSVMQAVLSDQKFPGDPDALYPLDDNLKVIGGTYDGMYVTDVLPLINDKNGDGIVDLRDLLLPNETTIDENIVAGDDYSVTLKDDGKLLYRWGNTIKKPNDVRLEAEMQLPDEWKVKDPGSATPDLNPLFRVTQAELVVHHTITNNPNDQVRPEDYENEAATGTGPTYTILPDGKWVSTDGYYAGDGTFYPAGTVLKDPALAAAAAGTTLDQFGGMSADLVEGFTNAWYTTMDREPFEPILTAGDTDYEVGPRWRLQSDKYGQDLPSVVIPIDPSLTANPQKDEVKYEVGAETQTVLNLLDWANPVSPLAISAGWLHGDGRTTVNGVTLSDNFDLSIYIKGDIKPATLYSAELVMSYEEITIFNQGVAISGTSGEDFLAGRGGNTFTGGLGADLFTLSYGALSSAAIVSSTITDFEAGSDTIGLIDLDVNSYTFDTALSQTLVGSTLTLYLNGVQIAVLTGQSATLDESNFLVLNPHAGDIPLDAILGTDAGETLTGDAGDNTIFALGGDDIVLGLAGMDTLYGGTGNDQLYGGDDADTLYGEAGNDTLGGGLGADRLVGGTGNDTYYVDNAGDTTIERAGEGIDTVFSNISFELWQQNQFLENLTLSGTANINGTGNSLANTITGNTGANVLNGGLNADRMVGGLGNDTYYVDNSGDTTIELAGEGTDTVFSSVSYLLWNKSQYIENLTLAGAGNIDGGGNTLANVLIGNTGNNVLNGGANADRMIGGQGDDTYYVDNVGDTTIELAGQGTDSVFSSASYFLWNQSQHIETLTLTGTGNIDGGGNTLANTLTGNAGNNSLNGGVGADQMAGGAGNDTYYVDNFGDTTTELDGQGTDTVISSVGFSLRAHNQFLENLTLTGTGNLYGTGNTLANTVTGNAGNNTLNGAWGNDTLIGGAGNDILNDDAGNDIFTGGAGADTFFFLSAGESDRITDFENGIDSMTIGLGVSSFANITVTDSGADAILTFGSNTVTLENFDHTLVSSDDFSFV